VAATEGRLVLLTGAASGIGRCTAGEFAGRGARVAAVDRDAEGLESLARDHERVFPLVADVTDGGSMEAMARRVLDEHGVPDVVVANAGIGLDALLVETRDEDLRQLFDVNVFGVYRTVRPFVGAMVERGSGRLLLMSSIVGKRGAPHYSAYSASKFALHGIADALRCELWGTRVTVGVLCPASTRTSFQRNTLRTGTGQKRVRPVRRTPESVARAVVSMAGSRRRERILGVESKAIVFVDSLLPGLIDRIFHRLLCRG
jgi:NAD(P)-dependent dehydrogenase (short-subunit alcohol dehydrogenase family)